MIRKLLYGAGGLGASLFAATAALADGPIKAPDAAHMANMVNKGDTTWMMISTVLVLVMGCEGEGGVPETVLINPSIVFYGPQQVENWEGCLSVDGLRGKVTRPSVVRVQALDRQGKSLDFEATGLYAVCIQHEMDHLIGKVFLDRMTDLSTLTQLAEFDHYWKKDPAAVI